MACTAAAVPARLAIETVSAPADLMTGQFVDTEVGPPIHTERGPLTQDPR
jgi:hypothetical protein